MRNLLKTNDRRRLELIELLIESRGWTTSEEIAKQLQCSVRVLKEDIAFLRQTAAEIDIQSSYEGIRLIISNDKGIKHFYRKILKESLVFQIMELIFFDETLMINDLAEQLHASPSTIYRAINQIHDYFFNNHQSYIETNPCRFVGNEAYIRNFYRAYFSETHTIIEWPFPHIDEEEVNQKFNRVLSLISKDVEIDFAYYKTIKLTVIVNLIRYQHGHLIETADHESNLFKLLFTVFKTFIVPKGSKRSSNHEINTEYIYQVYDPYIRTGVAYNKKHFRKLRKKDPNMNNALSFLEKFLVDLSQKIDISINVEDVLFSIVGTNSIEDHDLNSKYILYNRNHFFVQTLRQSFPHIFQQLYEGIVGYRTRLKKDLDEDKINMLIYTLFTYWDNLLTDLYRKHQNVSLLVLSDGHYSHAKMIQNLLSFELRSNITIDVYKGQELSLEKLNQSNYDLIVSTFSLAEISDKEVIIINHFPTFNDIIAIESCINKIILRNKDSSPVARRANSNSIKMEL